MGGVSGLEAARELRSRGDKVRIIFLTSLPQYALEGYEVQAYSFLLKPVLYATLADKLKGIFRLMDEETGKVLKLKNSRGITLIPVKSIIYAESQKHNVILVHENGRDIFQLAMKDLEEQVGGGFFRCHKGYIVNLCMVSQIGPEFLIMGNGDRVPVSRHRRADFIRYFRAYMGDRLCG